MTKKYIARVHRSPAFSSPEHRSIDPDAEGAGKGPTGVAEGGDAFGKGWQDMDKTRHPLAQERCADTALQRGSMPHLM
jgi:hypothetical protein